MKTFYLVRHAQYSNPRNILVGRLPVELSEEGKEEANKLALFFVDKNIEKIYSSPVLRCKQTSKIISNKKFPIEYDLRLAETFSAYQGYWELDWAHFYKHHSKLGGELATDVQKRVVDFYDEINNKNKGDVIICSHGDSLYLLYAHLLKLPTPDIKEIYKLPDQEYQPKASIRPIFFDKDKISVKPLIEITDL
ncbi:histidine phosphatase family protein [Patescibacteria group bacterium]|nr:histidine phosphatase family protein [Patescibacteria group bacterium]MBU2543169.1 histidine phosphatase family protein [Patescibacteria group bacterium]